MVVSVVTETQQQLESVEPQRLQPPVLPKAKLHVDPIKKILLIQKDVIGYMDQVANFTGDQNKKIFLDEMLTRCIVELDKLDQIDDDEFKYAKKEMIKCIYKCVDVLEIKAEKYANTPEAQDDDDETEHAPQNEDTQTDETLESTNENNEQNEKIFDNTEARAEENVDYNKKRVIQTRSMSRQHSRGKKADIMEWDAPGTSNSWSHQNKGNEQEDMIVDDVENAVEATETSNHGK